MVLFFDLFDSDFNQRNIFIPGIPYGFHMMDMGCTYNGKPKPTLREPDGFPAGTTTDGGGG